MTTTLITAISWERVHLTLSARLSCPTPRPDGVEFMIVDGERSFPVPSVHTGDGQYRLEINVTNFHERSQVPNGTWQFVPHVGGEPLPAASYDLSESGRLDEDSRTFLYAGNQVAYVVNFDISEDDEDPALLMRTYQLFRKAKRNPDAPRPPLRRRLARRVLPRARRVRLANHVYRLARLVSPPRGNRILFASEMATTMGGNLARVHQRLAERGLDGRFAFRYSFRHPDTANKWTTLRAIWLLATSDIVLVDNYFALLASLSISPETKIIQLWHAGSGFKSIGYSRFGRYGSPRLANAHRKYTYAITGSKNLVSAYAEAFGIEESAVVATGLPRIDTFLDEEHTREVVADFFTRFPDFRGKRIILFAPTFRGRGIKDAHYDYSRIDFAQLYEMCGDTSVVLFRMHHFVPDPIPIPPQYADRLFDFASFPEMNDLLHVTDVLVTDYSSSIYEFALLDRPMLFYAYDKDTYSVVRGFHRDFDETAPGKVCTSFDDLLKALQDEDYDTWKIERFRRENIDYVDTGSADRVIDWLILADPHTSTRVTETVRELAGGDMALGDEILTDQSEA